MLPSTPKGARAKLARRRGVWARTANPAPVEGVFHRSEQGGEVFHEDSSSWLALLLSAPDDTKGEREQPIQDQVLGS